MNGTTSNREYYDEVAVAVADDVLSRLTESTDLTTEGSSLDAPDPSDPARYEHLHENQLNPYFPRVFVESSAAARLGPRLGVVCCWAAGVLVQQRASCDCADPPRPPLGSLLGPRGLLRRNLDDTRLGSAGGNESN